MRLEKLRKSASKSWKYEYLIIENSANISSSMYNLLHDTRDLYYEYQTLVDIYDEYKSATAKASFKSKDRNYVRSNQFGQKTH
jgi:hypothetical protein